MLESTDNSKCKFDRESRQMELIVEIVFWDLNFQYFRLLLNSENKMSMIYKTR